MADQGSWKLLNDRGGEGVILAADFPATGRPEAGFAEFAPRIAPGLQLWETVPTGAGAPGAGSGADQVARWVDGLPGGDIPVVGVFGYCAGSVYAAALAEHVTKRQESAPAVVLFDPEAVSELTLYWQFHKVVGNLSVVLSPTEVGDAQEAGKKAREENPELVAFGAALDRIFQDVGRTAFARAGLDAERSAELGGTFTAFVSYLTAATEIDYAAGWAEATAITSRTETNGLNLARSNGREDLIGREITFDIDHADLLRDENVARTVLGLLG